MIVAFWILLFIAAIVILVSFALAPDSNAFSGALVGSSDLDLFRQTRERGSKKLLKWLMFGFGILLLIIAVVVRFLS